MYKVEIMGVAPSAARDAIAFGEMTPQEVHISPDYRMSFSDANARLHLTDSPFSIFWAVAETEAGRVAFTRITVLNDRDDPLVQAIIASTKKCPTLAHYLVNLNQLERTISETFDR